MGGVNMPLNNSINKMYPDGSLVASERLPLPESQLNLARRSMSTEDYAHFSAVQLYAITYLSGGLFIKGFMALPAVAEEALLPALIFNRGGAGIRGALTAESAMNYAGLYASWGYICVASQYRGQGGSEGIEEWGGRDVDDALNLIPLLDSLNYADKARIGIIGGSRGGMMALQMLARTNRFLAAVTIGAPAALHQEPANSYIYKTFAKLIPEGQDLREAARARSATDFAADICKTTPLLVLHGTGDRRVDPMHGYKLGMALQQCNHPYKLVMYDNADHVLAGRRNESNEEIRQWVDRYVKRREALPKTGPHGA